MNREIDRYVGVIALDGWSDSHTNSPYFGLTALYITKDPIGRLVMNDRVLVIRELSAERSKCGEYIRRKLMEYLTETGWSIWHRAGIIRTKEKKRWYALWYSIRIEHLMLKICRFFHLQETDVSARKCEFATTYHH